MRSSQRTRAIKCPELMRREDEAWFLRSKGRTMPGRISKDRGKLGRREAGRSYVSEIVATCNSHDGIGQLGAVKDDEESKERMEGKE